MPFSGWELVILAVIVLVFFGYKYLPQLAALGRGGRAAAQGGRAEAGGSARAYVDERGPEAKAYVEERKETAKAYVEERKPDAGEMGRTAGKHVREYRDLKDEVMGTPKPGAAKPESKP